MHLKKKLRTGYTTGTCAAAAAKGALLWLLGRRPEHVTLQLPAGLEAVLPVCAISQDDASAACEVIKDGGDDPDVTNGAAIQAQVSLRSDERIAIHGGAGVGLVTRPGLAVAPGEPAINPVPRMMIKTALQEILPSGTGADVTISVSRGKELAKKTLNPRLGITGGISILGSTGIVIPYSHEAYRESIACALDVAQASGITTIVFSTGKSSEKIARKVYNHLPEEAFVLMADHFAHALQSAQERGFTRISICCFPAKLLKMASGLENTHCTRASIDLELLSKLAVRSGISNKTARALAQANTVRHAVEMLQAGDAIRLCAHMARIASEFINTLTRHPVEKEILVLGYDNTVLYHSK